MSSIFRFISLVKSTIQTINPSTLTGAIDVIVVKQEDGTLRCTPFHVRFGKLGVLQNQQNKVYIMINGTPVEDLFMELGEAGEAVFVAENSKNSISEDSTMNVEKKQIESSASTVDNEEREENRTASNNFQRSKRSIIKNRDDSSSGEDQQIDDKRSLTKRSSRARKRESFPQSKENPEKFSTRRRSVSPHEEPVFQLDSDENDPHSHSSTPFSDAHSRLNSIDSRQKFFRNNSPTKFISTENQQEIDSATEDNSLLDQQIPIKTSRTSSNPIPIEPFNKVEPMSPLTESSSIVNSLFSQSAPVPSRADPIENELNRIKSNISGETNDFSLLASLPNDAALRPTSPKSDTEYELEKLSQQTTIKNAPASRWRWNWGELPKFWPLSSSKSTGQATNKKNVLKEDVYLDDIANNKCQDPSLYLLQVDYNQNQARLVKDEDQESGTGNSIPHSPVRENEMSYLLGDVQLSLCGNRQKLSEISDDVFNAGLVSYESFASNPSIINDPNLIVRINKQFYTWEIASTLIASTSIYQKQLPVETVEKLVPNTKTRSSNSGKWWPFSTRKSESFDDFSPSAATEALAFVVKSEVVPTIPKQSDLIRKLSNENEQEDAEVTKLTEKIDQEKSKVNNNKTLKKTLILTSDQLERLNLKFGKNQVEFSVTTALQGTTVVEANIFLFDHKTKFVISDIDGTITKSDVFGHILPLVGKDWSHDGITPFFQAIQENGYQFIYLSARAIGQSRITRNFLRNVKQCSSALPEGPLLISPDNLVAALYREVIEKKPEAFKIECLKNIRSLFSGKNPFYAGFGNRTNDQSAYTAVGIPDCRIFTINPRGEVVREKLSQVVQTSYKNLHEIVDQIFPPMDCLSGGDSFSSFTFWRHHPVKNESLDEEMRQDLEEMLKRQKSKTRLPSSPSNASHLSVQTQ